jgi:hypothetical protein
MWGAQRFTANGHSVMMCQSDRNINVVYVMVLSQHEVSALTRNLFPRLDTRRDVSCRDICVWLSRPIFLSYRLRRVWSASYKVPLVSDLPDVVIYDWHSYSCVLRDVERDWLSLGSHVDNQFNIAYLEFFLQSCNQTKTLTGRFRLQP